MNITVSSRVETILELRQCWENDIHMQKNEIGTVYHTQKSTQKQIEDLNVRPETVKVLEENMGEGFMILVLAMISQI